MNLLDIPISLMMKFNTHLGQLEEHVVQKQGAIQAAPDSPERFEIIEQALKRGAGFAPPKVPKALPHMIGSQWGIRRSFKSVEQNPPDPQTQISEAALAELEAYARSVDIVALGYTKLSKRFIFRDKAVLYANAILLVMEMDPHRIDTAPSRAAFVAVQETYHHLGDSANRIAAYLRERGYSAQAAHPLFGLALYPPLAQEAGLGWLGLNGLLITPEYGPCVRLAAVFTSIENLPFCEENEHAWIEDYCQRCRVCVAKCPPQAILEQPVRHDTGLITCIEREKCFPYFVEQYGCSICVRVCPFHKTGYAKLKRNYDRRHKNRQG